MSAQGASREVRASYQVTLVALVVFLFFAWGFVTVLNDTLVPKFRGIFSLSYTEVMLTQFSFFFSYFVFSIPAGLVLSRIGYIRGIVLGLAVTVCGCLLFAPAAALGVYAGFLAALFVIAAGITMLQVAANPFIELLGPESTSSGRLTLAQAFNSFATFIGPPIGAYLILRSGVTFKTAGLSAAAIVAQRASETHVIVVPFMAIAAALALLTAIFWFLRNSYAPPVSGQANLHSIVALLNRPRLVFGTIAIFVYVGAEVSIGSVLTNYLMQPSVLAVTAERAGQLLSFYWGGAMVGRFIGAFVLRIVRPGYALAVCALGSIALALTSSASTGVVAAVTLLAVGLCNSIMFPTIFSLATEQLGDETPHGSGLLATAIVGGAIVPVITGRVADTAGLSVSLIIPALCYVWIAIYGVLAARGLGLTRST